MTQRVCCRCLKEKACAVIMTSAALSECAAKGRSDEDGNPNDTAGRDAAFSAGYDGGSAGDRCSICGYGNGRPSRPAGVRCRGNDFDRYVAGVFPTVGAGRGDHGGHRKSDGGGRHRHGETRRCSVALDGRPGRTAAGRDHHSHQPVSAGLDGRRGVAARGCLHVFQDHLSADDLPRFSRDLWICAARGA